MTQKPMITPGRLCLFGEHEDWVSKFNKNYQHCSLIMPLKKMSIKSHALPHSEEEVLLYEDGYDTCHHLPLNEGVLREYIYQKNFFSIAAGVVLVMMQNFEIHGIIIEIESEKLPIGMGLSSSAAFCVMIVKSFNEIYHLDLSLDDIKYYAQLGENTALSPCGSLDYEGVTASGLIWYDFLNKTSMTVKTPKDMFLTLVPLKKKNTGIILETLQKSFPYPHTSREEMINLFFTTVSPFIAKEALSALNDMTRLGQIMNYYQKMWNGMVAPQSQVLQDIESTKLIFNPEIQKWIYGGKGVGSHGDGAVQLLCKTAEAQDKLHTWLEAQEYKPYKV